MGGVHLRPSFRLPPRHAISWDSGTIKDVTRTPVHRYRRRRSGSELTAGRTAATAPARGRNVAWQEGGQSSRASCAQYGRVGATRFPVRRGGTCRPRVRTRRHLGRTRQRTRGENGETGVDSQCGERGTRRTAARRLANGPRRKPVSGAPLSLRGTTYSLLARGRATRLVRPRAYRAAGVRMSSGLAGSNIVQVFDALFGHVGFRYLVDLIHPDVAGVLGVPLVHVDVRG